MSVNRFYGVLVSGDYLPERLNTPQNFVVTAWVGQGIRLPVDYLVTVTTAAYIDTAELHEVIGTLFFGLTPLLRHVSTPITITSEQFVLEIADL